MKEIDNRLMQDKLGDYLKDLSLEYEEEQCRLLIEYMNLVLDRNEKINLTAVLDPDSFLLRHYVDSLSVCLLPEYRKANRIVDLGTGAGFPGIPLAIMSPQKEFVLMDSLAKRLKVIDEFAAELNIGNVRTVHGRAEDLGRDPEHRGVYDLCLSRAVSNLATLSEYCLPLVRMDGSFMSYKGSDIDQEVADAKKAIKVLGGQINRIQDFSYGELSHKLIIVNKVKATPKKYPRKAGTPAKAPIR